MLHWILQPASKKNGSSLKPNGNRPFGKSLTPSRSFIKTFSISALISVVTSMHIPKRDASSQFPANKPQYRTSHLAILVIHWKGSIVSFLEVWYIAKLGRGVGVAG